MPVQTKDRAAADAAATLRQKAADLRAEMLDPSKEFTKDEILKKQDAIAGFEMRAAAAANFTPDAEIEDQGGIGNNQRVTDETRGTPENRGRSTTLSRHEKVVARLRDDVIEHFGGPNSLLLALAKRTKGFSFNEQQNRVITELGELTHRTITAATGGASGAEYLLPIDQVQSIFQVPMEVGGIMSSARRFSVRGREIRIPYLVQTDATGSNRPMAGIADVTIVGEGATKPAFEPKFLQRLLKVYKYAGYTEIADETLDDDMTGELAPTVQNVIGGQIMNKINEDLTADGTGSSQPLGAFHTNNAALYKQTRKTAGTILVDDIFNMYAHHILGASSAWYVHPSAIPKFMNLTLSGTTLVTFLQTLSGKPQMQLLGLPVIVTPLMKVLGLEGDIGLANGAFYAMALRQALTVESSIHYKFRDDLTAYRFVARAGGIPIPDGTYSYKAASSVKEFPVSPFVVLDDVQTP